MESLEIMTMRFMALERAKGELNAMLNTFWIDDPNNPGRPSLKYKRSKECIDVFFNDITKILD